MQRAALVVVQALAPLVIATPIGTGIASLLAPILAGPAFLRLQVDPETRVRPRGGRRRGHGPGGECGDRRNGQNQSFHPHSRSESPVGAVIVIIGPVAPLDVTPFVLDRARDVVQTRVKLAALAGRKAAVGPEMVLGTLDFAHFVL
jgi:hypothetical protein